jgi:hypothetical protein
MNRPKPIGYRILIVTGFFLLAFLLLGQTMAVIDYDFTVSIGLQESKSVMGEMGVAANRGFGVGDTAVYVPLLALGLYGLLKRRPWGVFSMAGAMAITAYWPVTCMFILIYARNTEGFHFTNYSAYAILLTLITIYGLWGLWYLYSRRNVLFQGE